MVLGNRAVDEVVRVLRLLYVHVRRSLEGLRRLVARDRHAAPPTHSRRLRDKDTDPAASLVSCSMDLSPPPSREPRTLETLLNAAIYKRRDACNPKHLSSNPSLNLSLKSDLGSDPGSQLSGQAKLTKAGCLKLRVLSVW